MYQKRKDREFYDVVDLDPYGTAVPFLDSAIQALGDGGML
jgi:tRNA (guanine26-N2/guanine27-N2)-dimethyltransferase